MSGPARGTALLAGASTLQPTALVHKVGGTATALGLSRRQVQHAWKLARGLLQRELERQES